MSTAIDGEEMLANAELSKYVYLSTIDYYLFNGLLYFQVFGFMVSSSVLIQTFYRLPLLKTTLLIVAWSVVDFMHVKKNVVVSLFISQGGVKYVSFII